MDHIYQHLVIQLYNQFVLRAKARFVANVDFPTPPLALEIAIVNLVPSIGFFLKTFGSTLFFIAALSSGFFIRHNLILTCF